VEARRPWKSRNLGVGIIDQSQHNQNKLMSSYLRKFAYGLRPALAAVVLATASSPTQATVIGSNFLNADGSVTYLYRVDNTDGVFDISAWSLEFGFSSLDWNPLDAASGGSVSVPNLNWFADVGNPVLGLSAQDFISLTPRADVIAGQALSGFSFTSRFLPGSITYHEFLSDGSSITGTTIGPVQKAPDGDGPLATMACIAVASFGAGIRKLAKNTPPLRQS